MKKNYFAFVALFLLTSLVLITSCKKDDDDKDTIQAPTIHNPLYVYSTYYYASWGGVSGVDGYKLDIATDAGFTNFVPGYQNKDMGTKSIAEIEGLSSNTGYFMRVKSYNSNGESGYSGTREVNTAGIDTLPNLNFERWISYVNYSDPSPYRVWATANKTVDLDPATLFPTTLKSTDAHSGNFAAKMFSTTELPGFNYLVTGNVTTGVFSPNLSQPLKSMIIGVPYKSKPSAFSGWFKYTPGPGGIDSCEIRMTLTKWNSALGQKDTIGQALYRTTNTFDVYTEFNVSVIYRNQNQPDTIEVVFASSSAGGVFQGQNGSTLYIDDVSFIFNK